MKCLFEQLWKVSVIKCKSILKFQVNEWLNCLQVWSILPRHDARLIFFTTSNTPRNYSSNVPGFKKSLTTYPKIWYYHLPSSILTDSGPPESPSQESLPPSLYPAHMKMDGIYCGWPARLFKRWRQSQFLVRDGNKFNQWDRSYSICRYLEFCSWKTTSK